jgi:hypothetical protein
MAGALERVGTALTKVASRTRDARHPHRMPEPGGHRLLGEPYRTTVHEIGRSGVSNVWRSVPLLPIASDPERHIGGGLVAAARGAGITERSCCWCSCGCGR